jgi:hypothetical protein
MQREFPGNADGKPRRDLRLLGREPSKEERELAALEPAERAALLSSRLREKEFERRIAAEASAWRGCAWRGGLACGGVGMMILGTLFTGKAIVSHGALPPDRPGWAIMIGFAAAAVGGLAALIFSGPAVIGFFKWIGTIIARVRSARRG